MLKNSLAKTLRLRSGKQYLDITALKVLKKLLKKYHQPTQIMTDKLGSYRAALRDLGTLDKHETGRYQNNQCENSHLHFRRRERAMCHFRSMATLQKFTSIQATFHKIFNHQRHIENRIAFKSLRNQSLTEWRNLLPS